VRNLGSLLQDLFQQQKEDEDGENGEGKNEDETEVTSGKPEEIDNSLMEIAGSINVEMENL